MSNPFRVLHFGIDSILVLDDISRSYIRIYGTLDTSMLGYMMISIYTAALAVVIFQGVCQRYGPELMSPKAKYAELGIFYYCQLSIRFFSPSRGKCGGMAQSTLIAHQLSLFGSICSVQTEPLKRRCPLLPRRYCCYCHAKETVSKFNLMNL